MKRLGEIVTVVVTVAVVAVVAWKTDSHLPRSSTTQPGAGDGAAPAVGGMTLAGQRWNLRDQHGKVVLLDFWATWCPSCVASMPAIKKIHEHFQGNGDFILVGVNEDYSKPPLEAFVQKNAIGWLQIYDPDSRSELGRAFHVQAIPATFLIDRQGNTHSIDLDPDELIAEIEKFLKAPG